MRGIDLFVEELGPQGDGIAYGRRERVFVERSVPGDRVAARIFRDDEGVARGEILEIIEPSDHRQEAPCVHYERCGGCTLQHLEPTFYREWKLELVRSALARQDVRPKQWREPKFVGSHSRRRATFTAYKDGDRLVVGYYRRRSHFITDVDACWIADPRILALREKMKPWLRPILKEGLAIDLFLQVVGDSVDLVVTGAVGRRGELDPSVREAMARLVEATSIRRISWRASERDELEAVVTRGPVTIDFGGMKVNLPPAAFLQPTSEGEQALVNAVMEAVPSSGKFADLFSGCGTFSGPLLQRGSVDAYESVPSAVRALSKAAGTRPLRVFRRDLFRNPLRRDEINRYDAVVFDPPRAGGSEQALHLASSKAGILIGVSCNPATFARDARILREGGYRLRSVQVIDQFLWSHHVELVGVFEKGKGRRG